MKRIAVYTAFTRRYDMLFPPEHRPDGVRFVAFVDDRARPVDGWHLKPFPPAAAAHPPRLANRYCKFFPHKILPHTDYSVYIDGNIRIVGDIAPLLSEFAESRAAIGLFRHRQRTDLFQEFDACVQLGKFAENERRRAAAQLSAYRGEGMPPDRPLLDNGILFRCHRHPLLAEAMDAEWAQLRRFSNRDQLSLPYVLWKTGVPAKVWDWSFRVENPVFDVHLHRGFIFKDLLIWVTARRNASRFCHAAHTLFNTVRAAARRPP